VRLRPYDLTSSVDPRRQCRAIRGHLRRVAERGLVAGALWVALCCLLTVGCASKSESPTKPARPLKVRNISLVMLPNANEAWPVKVELVRVKDVALVDALLGMETGEWFGEAGRAFRQAHPQVVHDSWEVVPGTNVGPFAVQRRGRFAGVLFCDTKQPSPPLKFERNGEVTVSVGDAGCSLVGGNPSRNRRLIPW